MSTNVICPKCGALQKGLNLDETNGLYICSNCQAEVRVELKNTDEKIDVDVGDN